MESMSHRYAAVLAADVAHYSRLMEGDSEGTVQALKNCRAIFRRCVTSHHGREFGSVGDSLMAEFASPVEAIRAARRIHSELENDVAPLADGSRMRVRIGLHAGDVISDGENLFGDVVNTAARLQAIAKPGGITLSGFLHEQIRKERGVAFRSLGQHQLKNIAEPVNVFEVARQHRRVSWRRFRLLALTYKTALAATFGVVVAGAMFVAYFESQKTGIGSVIEVPVSSKSVAILPFRNESKDGHDDLLVNGIHADVITQLAKLPTLEKVTSRRSVEIYRDIDTPIGKIAQELSVTYIVESDVRRSGERLRINVQLVNALTDDHVWAESYDRRINEENLFAVQGEIARDIALALHLVLTAEQEESMVKPATQSIEAYNEFVLGHEEMAKMNEDGLLKAQAHFEVAVELDPNYVLAHVGRADALGLQSLFLSRISFSDTVERWQESITKALTLDPRSGEAHASLALLRALQDRPAEAEQLAVKAIELSPNYSAAYHLYANLLGGQGKDEESIIQFRKAFALDPNAPLLTKDFAAQLFALGRVEEAEVRLIDGIRRNPGFSQLYRELYLQMIPAGRSSDALRALHAWLVVLPGNQMIREWICFALIHLGDDVAAEKCIANLETDFNRVFVVHEVMLSTVRHQPSQSLEHLERFAARQNLAPIARQFIGQQYIFHGMPEKAAPYANDIAPMMMGEREIAVTVENIDDAFLAAAVLYHQGHIDRANYLFDQALDVMRLLPRVRGKSVQFRDILIYVVRDEKDLAIAALRDALRDHWRSGSWYLHTPMFSTMDEEPEWRELMERLESEMAEEVLWYREHKDDPLFE